jgi:hypothetical protein
MGRLLGVVERFFDSADLTYQRIPDKPLLALSMTGDNAAYEVLVIEHEREEQLIVYTRYPTKVPQTLYAQGVEYITRANWGLKIGNFEFDYSDGEIRYKTFIDIEGGNLTPKMVQNLFAANFMTADRYYPGLARVIWGHVPPATAIAEIETTH